MSFSYSCPSLSDKIFREYSVASNQYESKANMEMNMNISMISDNKRMILKDRFAYDRAVALVDITIDRLTPN